MRTRLRAFLVASCILSACGQGEPDHVADQAAEPNVSEASTPGDDIGGTLNLSIGLEPQQAIVFGEDALSRPVGNAPLISDSVIDSTLEELTQEKADDDRMPPT